MPFLSCNRVSGGGEITAASAESYLAALCWGAKGTPRSECFQQQPIENSVSTKAYLEVTMERDRLAHKIMGFFLDSYL